MTEDIGSSIPNFEEVYTHYRELEYKHELATKLHEAQLIIDHRMLSIPQVMSVLKQGRFPTLVDTFDRAHNYLKMLDKEKQNDN